MTRNKVRVIKGSLALMLALAGVAGVGNIKTTQAAELYETEDNGINGFYDDFSFGDSITGNISEHGDVDYFITKTPGRGKAFIRFKHTYADTYGKWDVKVRICKNGERTEIASKTINLRDSEDILLPIIGTEPSENNGAVYEIEVKKNDGSVYGVNYTIDTAFEATNDYEIEFNDAYATATKLSANGEVGGNIQKNGDKDFYEITPDANGRLLVSFNHTYADVYGKWNAKIFKYENGQYTELASNTISARDNENYYMSAIGAKKDVKYYVVVDKNDGDVIGREYVVKTQFTKTENYEKENNDSFATANLLPVDGKLTGNITNYGEKDYYVVKPTVDSVLSLRFKHNYADVYGKWNVKVYNYVNGEYKELSSNTISLRDDEFCLLPQISVAKGNAYYIEVTRNDGAVIGTEYTLFSSFPKKLSLSKTSYTYNQKSRKPSVKVIDVYGNEISPKEYNVTYDEDTVNAGKHSVKVTFNDRDRFFEDLTAEYNIKKISQKIKTKVTTKTLKVKSLKKLKKPYTFKIGASAKTKLSYKSSNKKVVSVGKTGKVTIKKIKKGKYTITVTAASNNNYKKATAKVTVKIK